MIKRSDIGIAAILLVTVALLSLARSVNYLLFHTLAEFLAIVVSFSMFTMTWASNRYLSNGYLVVLGGAYGAIGLVDVFHTLTFKGMNLFPGVSTNYPTQFWLTARYLEAVALLDELVAERFEVVDLAVEGDPDRAVLVGEGLPSERREVDDREPAVREIGRAHV